MHIPTLDESIELLKAVSGVDDVDPDAPLGSSEIDSLNLVEWVYQMQERHPGLGIDESIVDGLADDVAFRAVHDRAVHSAAAEAAGP